MESDDLKRYIETERLILMPVTHEIVYNLLDGQTNEIEKIGLKTSDEWPTSDTLDILPFLKDDLEVNKLPSGFGLWMIIKKEDKMIIGDAGFKGDPNEEGEIEIGYGIIPSEQRKGYGYEAVKGLMDWAFMQDNVRVIKADCLINNIGSIRILQKVGMANIGSDEQLLYWEVNSSKD